MKNFILGSLFIVGIGYLSCYMYELGGFHTMLKLGRYHS